MLQERSQIHAQCWLLGHLRYIFIYVLGFGYKFVERETTVIFEDLEKTSLPMVQLPVEVTSEQGHWRHSLVASGL